MPESRPLLADAERYTTTIDPVSRGGGEKFHPRSVQQAREHLLPQAIELRRRLQELPPDRRGPKVVFFATLLPNYLANTYYPRQLLSYLNLVPLGSLRSTGTLRTERRERAETPTKTLVLAGDDAAIQGLARLLEGAVIARTPKQALEDLRQIEELRIPELPDVAGVAGAEPAPLGIYEAVFHPDSEGLGVVRQPIDEATFEKWRRVVANEEGEILETYRREIGGLTFVPVRLATHAVPVVAAFNPLRSLRPLPELRPLPDVMRGGPTIPAPPAGLRPRRAAPIAVFDGGMDAGAPHFQPYVTLTDLATRPTDARALGHGTAVTSALLYGHLGGAVEVPQPPAPVHHYRVLPANPNVDPNLYVLLDQIQDTVRNGPRYDLVSLSVAPYESVDDASAPSRWTATLDELAYERDVLFVVAAGNNGGDDPATGLNRVQLPGDMVNGIAVGACTTPEPESPWARADYSAIGPGRPGARIQPMGVAFGGTTGRLFECVTATGSLGGWTGTSFAAPFVAGGLASLSAALGARSDPDTLRCLAVHSAERSAPDQRDQLGYGRLPRDFAQALEGDDGSVTLIYRGRAERRRVDRLLIPFPGGIPGGTRVGISWTLAYRSPTDPAEAAEYTKASLDTVFRPHQFMHTLTEDRRSTPVNIREQTTAIGAALARGATLSAHPRSKSSQGGAEAGLRDDGKWETLRHESVGMLARSLSRPVLDLGYLARDAGALIATAAPIPYTVAVTVRVGGDIDLYSRVTAEYGLLVPIELRSQARLQA